ncbi:MAG: hypothetical protein WAK26_02065 [Terracidiphilus sp.]
MFSWRGIRVYAGQVSSDGGSVLLHEAARKINLFGRLAACFSDGIRNSQQKLRGCIAQSELASFLH